MVIYIKWENQNNIKQELYLKLKLKTGDRCLIGLTDTI